MPSGVIVTANGPVRARPEVDVVEPNPVPRQDREPLDAFQARRRNGRREVEERVVVPDQLRRQLVQVLGEKLPLDPKSAVEGLETDRREDERPVRHANVAGDPYSKPRAHAERIIPSRGQRGA